MSDGSDPESPFSDSPSATPTPRAYDALLLVSFGGPEGMDDVAPFLENVVRGKGVPRERLLEAAEHYELFGGVSPLNAEIRALLAAVVNEFLAGGLSLPVYWGNRNWHPLLADTLRQMADDGIRRALAFVTSAFGSYAGCRQYLEDLARARDEAGPEAPQVDKLRLFYNHPGFIDAMSDRVGTALGEIPQDRRSAARIIFTTHSLPVVMANQCDYEKQVRESCRLVAGQLGRDDWELTYQSRSGPTSQSWLEPDIGDYLRARNKREEKTADVVVAPIGFVCEHMETVYDLDVEVAALCEELGVHMVRAAAPGCHPHFVRMIRELVLERLDPSAPRLALGDLGPSHDVCPPDCCPAD